MFVTLKHWMKAWRKTTVLGEAAKLLQVAGLGLENLEERLVMSAPGGSSLQAIMQGLPPSDHINQGTAANVTAAVSGATGATQYSWSLFNSGTSIATSNQPTFSFTPMAPGNYNLTVGVTDSSGASTQSNQASGGGRRRFAARRFRDAERGHGHLGVPVRSERLGVDVHWPLPAWPATTAASRPAIPAPRKARRSPSCKAPAVSARRRRWTPARYTLNFEAAQRGNWQSSSQTFQVQVDGTVVGTFKPTGTSYAAYTTNAFTVRPPVAHAITFVGLNPNGGDNTAFVDQVQLNTATIPTTRPAARVCSKAVSRRRAWAQAARRTSTIRAARRGRLPAVPAWPATTAASRHGNPSAPEGTQVAFLQSDRQFQPDGDPERRHATRSTSRRRSAATVRAASKPSRCKSMARWSAPSSRPARATPPMPPMPSR